MKDRVLSVLKPLMQPKGFKQEELEGIAELIAGNLTAESTDEEVKAGVERFVPFADLMQKVGNRYATGVENKYKGWKSQEEVAAEIERSKAEAVETYKKLNPAPVAVPPIIQKPAEQEQAQEAKPKQEERKQEAPKAAEVANQNTAQAAQTQPVPAFDVDGAMKRFQSQQAEYQQALSAQQAEYQQAMQKQMAELISKGVAEALRPYKEKTQREYLDGLLNSDEKVKAMPETFRRGYTLDKEENLGSLVSKMEADYAQLKQELLNSGELATPPASGKVVNDEDEMVAFLNGIATKGQQK